MHRPASRVLLVALAVAGCSSETKRSPNAQAALPASEAVSQGPSVPCQLDTANPGLMRRAGRAQVKLHGHGLAIERETTGVCGPLYNADVAALGVKAGEGLLFEVCLPEGYLLLSSKARVAGPQLLHGQQNAGGTDVSFNQTGGPTYSQRGLASDRVVVSEDFWKADAELVLRDVQESGELTASIHLDCGAAPAAPAQPSATR